MARRIAVRRSPIHGRGVFALVDIPADEVVIDYRGELTRWEEVTWRDEEVAGGGHTFLFDIGDGLVIDGGNRGNSARWINHSCEPNCEAEVVGQTVVITTIRDIAEGEELVLDYQLRIGRTQTATDREVYSCGCGAASCRSTMLAPSRSAIPLT